MTAFNRSDIPITIDTIEKLSVWCSTILRDQNLGETVQTSPGKLEEVASAAPFLLRLEPPKWSHFSRCVLLLNPLWDSNGKKVWENVLEVKTGNLPNTYKS